MEYLIVIPARFASTRFPGKPLALIAGRSLLERVVDCVRRGTRGLKNVTVAVATDDERIALHADALGCTTLMTDPEIASGSGRALAAARAQADPPRFVVNVQGDAPFLPGSAIPAVMAALAEGASVATPIVQLTWSELDRFREQKLASPFSGTTCIRSHTGDALWFSKQIVPAIREEAQLRARSGRSPVFRHLGLYGYRLDALVQFEAAPPSHYERLEGLEQLRVLELGIPIRTVIVEEQDIPLGGIDTPTDARLAEALIATRGDPFGR